MVTVTSDQGPDGQALFRQVVATTTTWLYAITGSHDTTGPARSPTPW